MKNKIFTERLEIRMTKEQAKMLKEISKKKNTTESESIRICLVDYWERL